MALEGLLVTVAACLMTWVIQTHNGGVLNILFKPDEISKSGNSTFSFVSEVDYNYFINLLLLRPLNFSVLRALPEQFGGGQKAVDDAIANPNREPMIFWTMIGASLLLTLLVLSAACCCGNGPSKRKQANTSEERFARHQRVERIKYTIIVIFALSTALATTILLVLYFGTLNIAFDASEHTLDGKVLSIDPFERIQIAMDEIKNFVEEGSKALPASVEKFAKGFDNKVNVSTAVLVYFGKKCD
ncbi:unnamed protein product [Rodentolepis nana]|uniref:Protein tweety homolog n=1 Tax=Rodentolepis nana TaxID=102285 RepID=A0A0R3TYZ6_RODNA|nr:unnamed protein product [Rodentolepis nana]